MNSNGWKEVKLGEVVEINKNSYSMKDNWDFVNYLDTGNITENKINCIQFLHRDRDKIPSRAKRKVSMNDVIYSTVRPNQKHYGIIKKPVDNMLVSTGFAVITGRPFSADNGFLYYYLSQQHIVDLLHTIGEHSTSAYPSIKPSDIESLYLLIPPYEEQKSIAATLSCLDDKIELNNRINKTLEEMAQAIFNSWFVDFEPFQDGAFEDSELGMIPKGWRLGTIDECIDFYNGYAFKSKELLDHEVLDSYHVFKMGHIKKGGGLNNEGTKSWIAKSDCKHLGKYVLKKGDLLMCMTDMKGNVALLGHTALMNVDDVYIINQRVGLLRANNTFGIDFPYLYILTNSRFFIENLRGRANSGVQVNLSTSEIKSSKIVIAPEEVNVKFNDIVRPIFDKIFEIAKENQLLIGVRDTLLPKLMSGEIRVPIEEVK